MTKMTWKYPLFCTAIKYIIARDYEKKVVDTQMTNLEARCLMKRIEK